MLNYVKISAGDTYPLRSKILRPGLPLKACEFKGDNAASTWHRGVHYEGELVGIVTITDEQAPNISGLSKRLRGMAIKEELQGQGMGQFLLINLIEEFKLRKQTGLWCYAREHAVAFYLKNNFVKAKKEIINLDGVGPHYLLKLL